MQRPEFVGDFVSLFRRLAIRFDLPPKTPGRPRLTLAGFRTTKAMVRHELGIPEQTRYLVPIDLGRVEKHVSVSLPLFSTYS